MANISNPKLAAEIPTKPAHRRAWVIYQLRLRGTSLRKLAHEQGINPASMNTGLMRPSSHVEELLAKTLGLSVQELFPERFDDSGRRLHKTMPPQRTPRPRRGNVQKGAAA